jgi:hypothetical protein
MSLPAPFAHQWSGFIPQAINKAANRFGKLPSEPSWALDEPQTGIDSSQGNPTVTPAPRNKVRRDICENGLERIAMDSKK